MSSGFVTETEAAEARKRRQDEWERVRTAEDPFGKHKQLLAINIYPKLAISERPEEPYDARSLYDRLQEQKQKKDLEYEEAHKLSNTHNLFIKPCSNSTSFLFFFRKHD